jgi:hypothetical protein
MLADTMGRALVVAALAALGVVAPASAAVTVPARQVVGANLDAA